MQNTLKRSLAAVLALLMLAACCPKHPAKMPQPVPPLKRHVEVREIKKIDGRDFGVIEIAPLLLNEEDQDNFIERVLLSPVWDQK